MRYGIPFILAIFSFLFIQGQTTGSGKTRDRHGIPDLLWNNTTSQVDGYVGEKLDLSLKNRILAQEVEKLVAPFRMQTETYCWQSEFWGKWLTSAVLANAYHPSTALEEKMKKAVDGILATQNSEGFIGNYAPDKHFTAWDIWGRKYTLLGLLAYYEQSGDKKSLQAAIRLADQLIDELHGTNTKLVKTGNHRGMASSSVLEPVCSLYRITGNQRYLDFAEEIVAQWETEDGPKLLSKSSVHVAKRFPVPQENWYGWEQGQKAYEMMSCYEGLLELYRLTGKTGYKEAVQRTWLDISDTEINITGSGSAKECWFGGREFQSWPVLHYQETCVTATWIKLSQQLLRLTGEARYADAIEQSFYNALLGALHPDGSDWAKYSPLSGWRLPGSAQCGMDLNCCVASGPRALYTFPLTAVMMRSSGFQVNFFTAGKFNIITPSGQKATLIQQTDYPVSGEIVLQLAIPRSEEMTIYIRIPSWSRNSILKVNGESFDNTTPGTYAMISRTWSPGDSIRLVLDMRGRIVHSAKTPDCFAILRGPVVLARDARLPGLPVETIIEPVTKDSDYLELLPVEIKNPAVWMQFKAVCIPESYLEEGSDPVYVHFCDYASAGNTWTDESHFRSWFPVLLDPSRMNGK
jgi:DUF1680 family protein